MLPGRSIRNILCSKSSRNEYTQRHRKEAKVEIKVSSFKIKLEMHDPIRKGKQSKKEEMGGKEGLITTLGKENALSKW